MCTDDRLESGLSDRRTDDAVGSNTVLVLQVKAVKCCILRPPEMFGCAYVQMFVQMFTDVLR